jgi:threonine synthase
MDVAFPSNLERFTADPLSEFSAGWSSDVEISETIADVDRKYDYLLDPHTATAWRAGDATRTARPQLVVATAHPAKFGAAVEAAVGRVPEIPEGFHDLFELPERVVTIDADTSALIGLIR